VLDRIDPCPLEPGPVDNDGCPRAVRLNTETGQIIILQRVEFATGRDVILSRSFSVLQEVFAVIQANPQILRVRIEGHTDDRGRDASNLELSRRRAASVVRWLQEHGIDASRLDSVGCGELHPSDTNRTTGGRQANRRVEFHVIEPAPPGGARNLEGCVSVAQ
jgi:outer membrane protein OmpA-like peptidoglycan-associated protein